MKASIDISTGLMHEISGDSVPDISLVATAQAVGISDVEVRVITQAEADILSAARIEASMTQLDRFKAIERAIEQHMDTVAKADGWDDRKSCALRAGYAGPWQAKGIAFGQWMDSCWSIAIQAQADVVAGARSMPTPEQAVAELPNMVW